MKTVEIKVKNCRNCPFSEAVMGEHEKVEYANCLAPSQIHVHYKIDSYYINRKSPKWCPLNNTQLIITK